LDKKKIQRVSDRCKRICGKKQSECFVNKKEQINCIADMVINKTSSIIMTLGASVQMKDSEFILETAMESLSDAGELSNWIKYLQIVPDLLTLSSLILDADSMEKRKEIRYPVPGELEGQIKVVSDDIPEARLVNFSQSGMQILSSRPIEGGAVHQYHLMSDIEDGLKNPFKAMVMYCIPTEGSYICGARIVEMLGSGIFNFFSPIHQLMLDMTAGL
jgi:hypothetical protein